MRTVKTALVLLFLAALLCLWGCGGGTAPEPDSGEYGYEALFQRFAPSVVWLQTSGGGGTGFFIEENLIVTNNHVIAGAAWVSAVTAGGAEYTVTEVVGFSESPDLALLRIDGSGVPLTKNTHGLSEGEPVCTIGAPMGIFPVISDGIVMMSRYEENGVQYLLSNIHSIGGNSGGPVLNRWGEVIGVVVGGMSDGPNSLDLVIHIDHLADVSTENGYPLSTREEQTAGLNIPDEEKYETVALADAQPGTLVRLGRYEQDNDPANGAEEILWLVLDREGSEVRLLSLYCLDTMAYHAAPDSVTWESSDIRAWLNGEFFHTAFTEAERQLIAETTVVNRDNPVYGTPGGADTLDRVYLLSLEEVQEYWEIPEAVEAFYDQLYAQATPYCMTRPIWLELEGINRCWWWLRSCGGSENQAAEVGSLGYLSFNGTTVDEPARGIRPVIHVTLP